MSDDINQSDELNRVVELLKSIGSRVSQLCLSQGRYISPILASYTARVLSLQNDKFDLEAGLTAEQEEELIALTIQQGMQKDDPLYETIKMQVQFETVYATELQSLRSRHSKHEHNNRNQLNTIVQLGTNIQSNQQVASLYRALFKLMLTNSYIDASAKANERDVEREVAAALESVFPQSGLNAFQLMSEAEKKRQTWALCGVVLGIQVFNRHIGKGGAGLGDVPGLLRAESSKLYESLLVEINEASDVCYTYTDLLNLEHSRPGSLSVSVSRLQDELCNRRQFLLLLHQIQHEVVESLDAVGSLVERLNKELEELHAIVGAKTSVPKELVYPRFHSLSSLWRTLVRDRERTQLRSALLSHLSSFKASFQPSICQRDLDLLSQVKPQQETSGLSPDDFVDTVGDEEDKDAQPDQTSALDAVPKRVTKESCSSFLSLPLQYQGYCSWTLVRRGGLLMPGVPSLGIVRYHHKYYSFVSYEAMKEFCQDPDRFISGVLRVSRRTPSLIQLLSLQRTLPATDLALLFSLADLTDQRRTTLLGSLDKSCQVPADIEEEEERERQLRTKEQQENKNAYGTKVTDSQWNEWELRRQLLKMVDLMNSSTHSTQTDLSHFRRENTTQTYLPKDNGTQTGIEKGTNVSRQTKHLAGLRGHPNPASSSSASSTAATLQPAMGQVVQFTVPDLITHGSNPPLNSYAKTKRT